MATLATVVCTSHSPFLYATPEQWTETHARRSERAGYRADVRVDPPEVNEAKHARCMSALQTLREHLERARPDVLVIFGDDQGEQFTFRNFPSFAVYVGERFEGYRRLRTAQVVYPGAPNTPLPRTPDHWTGVAGHPALARYLLENLVGEGFDLAFSQQLPSEEVGMGHAIMRPLHYLTPSYDVPVVPFLVNCYFAPQPSGARCVALGRAIRRLVERLDGDLRVAAIGSGGLWHTPGSRGSYLDERFDQTILDALRQGDAAAAARCFDTARDETGGPEADHSGGTGMRGGLGGGSGEVRNWLIAAGVADGAPATVVDYVPVYASPIGMGFAYWERP